MVPQLRCVNPYATWRVRGTAKPHKRARAVLPGFNPGCAYITWQEMYDNEIFANVTVTPEQAKLVIGGEAAMWSTWTDRTNWDPQVSACACVHVTMTPRACARPPKRTTLWAPTLTAGLAAQQRCCGASVEPRFCGRHDHRTAPPRVPPLSDGVARHHGQPHHECVRRLPCANVSHVPVRLPRPFSHAAPWCASNVCAQPGTARVCSRSCHVRGLGHATAKARTARTARRTRYIDIMTQLQR